MQSYLNRGLPKCPQMLVSGPDVSLEQAQKIILRTDRFLTDLSKYSGGNNKSWNQAYRMGSGIQDIINKYDDNSQVRAAYYQIQSRLEEVLGILGTNFVENNWASCYVAGGPHGWCSPLGKIEYFNNIGKWPSVEEVFEDWALIANSFPFLEASITLMDKESCEEDREAIVSMQVSGGKVQFLDDPDPATIHPPDLLTKETDFCINEEQGLPEAWVVEYARQVKQALSLITAD